jgi:hypothetical protein
MQVSTVQIFLPVLEKLQINVTEDCQMCNTQNQQLFRIRNENKAFAINLYLLLKELS